MKMEEETVIKCAYADLVGALQAKNQSDILVHDWEAHELTIKELEKLFNFIEPISDLGNEDIDEDNDLDSED